MRGFVALLLAVFVVSVPVVRATASVDAVLVQGLEAAATNGVDAMLRAWYSDRPALAVEMKEKLFPATRDLGEIIDTEVVAVQPISRRVTRYYVAVYFERCPLWLRVERYANGNRQFYLPLRFSTNPDDIMPGYITEFFPAR